MTPTFVLYAKDANLMVLTSSVKQKVFSKIHCFIFFPWLLKRMIFYGKTKGKKMSI